MFFHICYQVVYVCLRTCLILIRELMILDLSAHPLCHKDLRRSVSIVGRRVHPVALPVKRQKSDSYIWQVFPLQTFIKLGKRVIKTPHKVQSFHKTPHYTTDLYLTWSCCGSHLFYHGILQVQGNDHEICIIPWLNCIFITWFIYNMVHSYGPQI